jgi:long-chain acyl-CoA synthetase
MIVFYLTLNLRANEPLASFVRPMAHLDPEREIYATGFTSSETVDASTSQIYRHVKFQGGAFATSFPRFPDALTLRDLFQQMIVEYRDCPALGSETRVGMKWLTYREFGALVMPLALGLMRLGLRVGELVAVVIDRCAWFCICQWALACQGSAMVAISPSDDASQTYQRLRILRVNTLVCSKKTFGAICAANFPLTNIIVACRKPVDGVANRTATNVVMLSQLMELGQAAAGVPFDSLSPDSIGVVNFGIRPEGVRKPSASSHANVIAAAVAVASSGFNFGRDVYYSSLPVAAPLERSIQLSVLAHGGSIGFTKTLDAIGSIQLVRPTVAASTAADLADLAESLCREMAQANCITRFLSDFGLAVAVESCQCGTKVPWLVAQLLVRRFRGRFGGRIRLVVSAIGALEPRVQQFFRAVLQIPVIQVYGCAETSGIIAIEDVLDADVSCVGAPAVTCEVRIRDVTQTPLSRGVFQEPQGEIMVRGGNVFVGYYDNQGRLNRTVFSGNGWFVTGDVGILRGNGTIEITGRTRPSFGAYRS